MQHHRPWSQAEQERSSIRAGALLVGGLFALAIMLRALDVDAPDANFGAFFRTWLLGLAQAFLIQDPIKVRA